MTIELMLPTPRIAPFSAQDWIFEVKWDGYRALCLIENKSVRFMSRNKKELTARFPELSTIHEATKAKSAILDGEIVGLDAKGRPCFEDLQNRNKCHITYFAFDVLAVNNNDLRSEPLMKRKEALRTIITPAPHLQVTEYVVAEGEQLFAAISKLGLEGMVAKKADSLYTGGKTKDWLKIKTRTGKEVMKKRIETWGR
jgi:bifunctional non-homologous end joining protein LigD